MKSSPSSYIAVIRHGARLFQTLGWKRSLGVQGLGLLASGLYALGLASLIPVLGLLSNGEVALPSVLRTIIAHIPLIRQNGHLGILLLLGMLLIFVLRSLSLSLYYGYGGRATEDFTRKVRNNLLAAYAQDREHHATESAKTRILYLNSQLPQLSSFNWGIIYCSLQIYTLLVLIVANIYFSPVAFAVSLAIGLAIVPLTQPILKRISQTGARLFAINQRTLTQANNFTEGFETVTTLNVRDNLQAGIDHLGRQAMHEQLRLGIAQGVIAAFPEILISLVAIGFYFTLGSGGVNGPLIAIAGYSIVRLVGTIGQLNEKMGDLLKLTWISDELHGFLQAPRAPANQRHMAADWNGGHAPVIRFENVTISVSQRDLVKDVSIVLAGPGIYQFAGPNGSGKSTLLRAIAGLMPYRGRVIINEQEVNTLTRNGLVRYLSYHGQENFLLEGTFLDNVLLGNTASDRHDVERLIAAIGLQEHPMFAAGLDFPIAESSSNLSGGERQLICALRTLLRDTPIYLFDEYTNHLGQEVADRLSAYLRKMEGRMIIIVSHANLDLAERVFGMEHGKLVTITDCRAFQPV